MLDCTYLSSLQLFHGILTNYLLLIPNGVSFLKNFDTFYLGFVFKAFEIIVEFF